MVKGDFRLVFFGRRGRELLQVEPYRLNVVTFIADQAHCIKRLLVDTIYTMLINHPFTGELTSGRSILGWRRSGAVCLRTYRHNESVRNEERYCGCSKPDKANIKYEIVPYVTLNHKFGVHAN